MRRAQDLRLRNIIQSKARYLEFRNSECSKIQRLRTLNADVTSYMENSKCDFVTIFNEADDSDRSILIQQNVLMSSSLESPIGGNNY
ncbi:hypothetical protein M514_06267 [Trichuris suis]|uniref:Uncharacterized protein n=1 Tax=Trichuris suis TaxID=68888 RepID=A0A085NR40_9BILA|nr:hypothetical protein M514_06267 [Trichuris suis]